MISNFRDPQPESLEWITVTEAIDLETCAYRVAWHHDPKYKKLDRPTTFSLLGTIAHAVVAETDQLSIDAVDDKAARIIIIDAWDRHASAAYSKLVDSWAPSNPPSPEEWPGYHLTKARIVRRSVQRLQRSASLPKRGTRSYVELPLSDESSRVRGRPDRIEGPKSSRRVVDLKAGIRQAAPTSAQRSQLLLYAYLVESALKQSVSEIAIENASGKRWVELLDRDSMLELIRAIEKSRTSFEKARERQELYRLASPTPSNCRWCPYRIVCAPYWTALETTWNQASVLGVVDHIRVSSNSSIVEVEAVSPINSLGHRWIISMIPEGVAIVGEQIAVIDAEFTGVARHLRWRWSTQVSSPRKHD